MAETRTSPPESRGCLGTHLGEFMGVAPTGERVMFTGTSIDRVVGAKVVESWVGTDWLGVMQQTGAVPLL